MYIIIAIVAFAILIFLHELGHFAAAKAAGIRVNEFAIGMGPKIISRTRGETVYSLRAFPIGGFCAMEGEDGDSPHPDAFTEKSVWRRLIVLLAGSFMNFLAGFLVAVILFSGSGYFSEPVLSGFMDGFPAEGENGLMVGDRILTIDGQRVGIITEVSMYLMRSDGTPDLVIRRDGKKIRLDDFPLRLREYETENGVQTKYGLYFNTVKADFFETLKQAWYNSAYFVKLVRIGLTDLFTGGAGVKDLSGPVGVVAIINQVGSESGSFQNGLRNVAYMCAFIAVNLAVMNLLPIPALDGGRIFLMLVTLVIEKVFRRKVNPKIEGYVHAAGYVLLLGLMAFVMLNDIIKLI